MMVPSVTIADRRLLDNALTAIRHLSGAGEFSTGTMAILGPAVAPCKLVRLSGLMNGVFSVAETPVDLTRPPALLKFARRNYSHGLKFVVHTRPAHANASSELNSGPPPCLPLPAQT